MERDWTTYLWVALGAAALWLMMRGRRAGRGGWLTLIPVAIAVAIGIGVALYLKDVM